MGRSLPHPRDEALVRRTLAGETEAFNTLIERYFGMVFALALSRVENTDTAEDLAQEVFLRAFLHLPKLREPRHFAAWLSRIARNLGTTWARRRQRSSHLVGMVPLHAVEDSVADPGAKGAAAAMERTEQDAALRDALRHLSPEQRDLVLLRFAEDLGQQEIAARLGMTQSTVSRQLKRALAQMRGHLEAVVVEAAPRLRAPQRATVRSIAIIATVGAMSATSKAALAAAAQQGTASTATSAGAAGMGLVATLLKPIAAVAAAGGSTMGFGKGVAAVVAVGAIIGGVHIATSNSQERPASADTASTSTASTDRPTPENWADWMRQFARENPGNDGLLALVEALELVTPADMEYSQAISDVISEGWRGNHPELIAVIHAQSPAMERAAAAAMTEDITFPPVGDASTPVPNFLNLQRLFKLFALEARRLEAVGDLNTAALRAVQEIRLSEHMIEDEATLIQNLIGIAGLGIGFRTLESIVAQPNLPPTTARAVAEELARLERVRQPGSALLRGEGRLLPNTVRSAVNGELDPSESGLSRGQALAMIGGDVDEFEETNARLWNDAFANLDRPRWEREEMDEEWIRQRSDLQIHQIAAPNFAEAVTRWETAWARARLCEAILGLRGYPVSGEEAMPIDNFDGQRIRSSSSRVWSVGPDMADQRGTLVYDPTNGTVSPGDIVARR